MIRFCEDNHIDCTLHGKNVSRGWIGLQDPWKSHDTGYHLGWNLSGCYLYSWSTGGHSLFSWMKTVAPNVDFSTALETYGDVYIDRRADWGKKTAQAETLNFPFEPLGKVARKYLTGRGFDSDLLEEKYRIRDGGIIGDWRFRIMIPFYYDKALVTFQGRDYTGKQEIRYKFLSIEASVINPKHVFYNMDNSTKDKVILTEGVFDCIRLAGDGGDVIASLGIATSEPQLRLLKARYKTVHICYDPEQSAQIRAKKLAEKLSAIGVAVNVWDTEKAYDLGDTSDEEAREIKKEILGG